MRFNINQPFAIVLLILALPLLAHAQCFHFQNLLDDSDYRIRRGEYVRAMKNYLAAAMDCEQRKYDALDKMDALFHKAKLTEDEKLIKVVQLATSLQNLQDSLRKVEVLQHVLENRIDSLSYLDSVVSKYQSEIEMVDTLIQVFEISQNSKCRKVTKAKFEINGAKQYGFIDEIGQPIPFYQTWDQATQFKQGYATVSRGDTLFKLDSISGIALPSKGSPSRDRSAGDYSGLHVSRIPRKAYFELNLEKLWAQDNALLRLCDKLQNLRKLDYADFSNNKLQDISPIVDCLNLSTLLFADNDISFIPENFSYLARIQSLDLAGNQIDSIPLSFYQLDSMPHLILTYNKIETVSSKISNFDSLKILEMSFNHLKSLPIGVSELQRLEYLGLTGNQLSNTKDCMVLSLIGELVNLKILRIGNNPLSDTEEERNAIRAYFLKVLPHCIVYFN